MQTPQAAQLATRIDLDDGYFCVFHNRIAQQGVVQRIEFRHFLSNAFIVQNHMKALVVLLSGRGARHRLPIDLLLRLRFGPKRSGQVFQGNGDGVLSVLTVKTLYTRDRFSPSRLCRFIIKTLSGWGMIVMAMLPELVSCMALPLQVAVQGAPHRKFQATFGFLSAFADKNPEGSGFARVHFMRNT